jgi:hypothetical protein
LEKQQQEYSDRCRSKTLKEAGESGSSKITGSDAGGSGRSKITGSEAGESGSSNITGSKAGGSGNSRKTLVQKKEDQVIAR